MYSEPTDGTNLGLAFTNVSYRACKGELPSWLENAGPRQNDKRPVTELQPKKYPAFAPQIEAEGWHAKTVTHIMGLRAFASQLLASRWWDAVCGGHLNDVDPKPKLSRPAGGRGCLAVGIG